MFNGVAKPLFISVAAAMGIGVIVYAFIRDPKDMLIGFGFLFLLASLSIGGVWFGEEWLPAYKRRKRNQPQKEPGLFKSYLKAKKDKVCPLIEYTN